jgi:putative ABC transport system permease protein
MQIVRQLMAESLVLAAAGGLAGLLLAFSGVRALLALAPVSLPLPKSGEVGLDASVLGFTALISAATAMLFGLLPALQASRVDLAGSLKQGGRGAADSRRRLRGALAAGEVALAMMLLTGAGLLAKSFVTLVSVDPGFRPERVLTFDLSTFGMSSRERAAAFVDQVLARVRAVPGVVEAGSIHFLPLRAMQSGTGMVEVGKQTERKSTWPGGLVSVVTPGYFRAMGIPVLRGRALEPRDTAKSPSVVVVNQAAARTFFDGRDPVGKRMYIQWSDDSTPIEVVGVVGNVRQEGLSQSVKPLVYLPNAQHPHGLAAVVVRSAAEPSAIAGAVKAAVREVDPNQPVANLREMTGIVSESVSRPRLYSVLLGVFAALAVALSSVGVYGVLAYSVVRRNRDIGVRMALGAEPSVVLRSVLREGLALAVLGLAAGTLGAAALTRYLSAMLFGVRPLDASVFAAAAAALLAVAFTAIYIPARRATQVDPVVALRCE